MSSKILVVVYIYMNVIAPIKGSLTVFASDGTQTISSCIGSGVSSLKVTCKTSQLNGAVDWYKDGKALSQCFDTTDYCAPEVSPTYPRYTFTSNIGIKEYYFSVSNFETTDQGNYTCGQFKVSTQGSAYIATMCAPVKSVTLKQNAIRVDSNQLTITAGTPSTLHCITDPTSPVPTPMILWYLGSLLLQNSTSTECVLTAAADNHDKVFYCGAYNTQPPDVKQSVSPKLYVKVRVSTVTIKLGSREMSTRGNFTVTAGTSSPSLSCTPGFSRPTATVDWYVGQDQKLSSSNTFTFTPANADHNKDIYCRAHNTDDGLYVDSARPKLYVNVRVSTVTIKQGSRELSTGGNFIVTAGTSSPSLSCTPGISRPTATVDWYIGQDLKLSSSNTLTFTPANADHNTDIYCRAQNTDDGLYVDSAKPKLYVNVKAESPRLLTDPLNFFDGDSYTIQCQSTPTRPSASITWTVGTTVHSTSNTTVISEENGGLVSVISTLSYVGSKVDHNASVICASGISAQSDWPDTRRTIKINWGPSTPSIEPVSDFPWLEDRIGKLSCVTNDWGNPRSEIVWRSTAGTRDDQNQLVIGQLSHQHDKLIVYCKLQNMFTVAKGVVEEGNISLNVYYKPILTIHVDGRNADQLSIIEGQDKDVICLAIGNPTPTVTWPDTSAISSGNSLRFRNIDRTQAGNYTCQGKAIASRPSYDVTTKRQIQVTVTYHPEVEVFPLNGTAVTENHTNVIMMCSAKGEPHLYKFHNWVQYTPDGNIKVKEYSSTSVEGGTAYLVFPTVSYMNAGIYHCFVENGIMDYKTGNVTAANKNILLVKARPVVTDNSRDVSAIVHGNAILWVAYYSNDVTNPSVKWYKNENDVKRHIIYAEKEYLLKTFEDTVSVTYNKVKVRQAGHMSQLFIQNVTKRDFGEYEVAISNSIGTTVWNLNLKAPVPTELAEHSSVGAIAGGVTAGVLILTVIIVASLMIWRRYVRKPDACCWNQKASKDNFGTAFTNLGLGAENKRRNVDEEETNLDARTGQSQYEVLSSERESTQPYEGLQAAAGETEGQKGVLVTLRTNEYEELDQKKRAADAFSAMQDAARGGNTQTAVYSNLKLSHQ